MKEEQQKNIKMGFELNEMLANLFDWTKEIQIIPSISLGNQKSNKSKSLWKRKNK